MTVMTGSKCRLCFCCTDFWGDVSAGLHSTRRQKRLATNAAAHWNTEMRSWVPLVSVLRPSTNPHHRVGICSRLPPLGHLGHCRQQETVCVSTYTMGWLFTNSWFLLACFHLFWSSSQHPPIKDESQTQSFSHLHFFCWIPPPTLWFSFFLKCPIMSNNDSKMTTMKTPKALHVM